MTLTTLDHEAREWLKKVFGDHAKFDEPMSRHTSLGVGGPAEAFVVPESLEALKTLIAWSRENRHPFLVVGDGTNLLVKDGGIKGIVIVLKACLKTVEQTGAEHGKVFVSAMAGAKMKTLCAYALKRGLKGMNFALGIPGTIGGGIIMNAGTSYGSVAEVLESINVLLPTGETMTIEKEQLEFSYRKLDLGQAMADVYEGLPVILSGCFRLQPSDPEKLKQEAKEVLQMRKVSQPLGVNSAGCFYKNPPSGKSAGELIDLAGLKGKSIGGATISSKHANFIVNRKGASAGDILALMNLIEETVSKMFDIDLEREVKIVGS